MKNARCSCLGGIGALTLLLASGPVACDRTDSVGALRSTGGVGAGGAGQSANGGRSAEGTGGKNGGGVGGAATGGTGTPGTGGKAAGGMGGGTGDVDAGVCPPGQVWCPGCAPGSGSCGPACVGLVCPEPDAGGRDVPLGIDSDSGPVSTGGSVGTGGRTGAGGTGTGGVVGAGGSSGTACMRLPDQDVVCRGGRDYPPRAFFCRLPAPAPSTACVMYNAIDSGDYLCCPDEYVTCPDRPPTDASACSVATTCTYGSHPDPACRISATCVGGVWRVGTVPSRCSGPQLTATCPADAPTGGAACMTDGLACYYNTGSFCACTNCPIEAPSCNPTAPTTWYCWNPPAGECPTYYPNLGSTCALPGGTSCRYTCAAIAVCSAEGVWVHGGDLCPECNAPDTPIATPTGERPIASLAPGDLIYSIHHGEMAVVPIAQVGRRPQLNHHVVRVALASGAVLEISPRHPTADGRTIGELATDDLLDGVRVVSATLVPYRHSHTYDILPASDTGTYYAGGVLIGSTMAPERRLARPSSPLCLAPERR